MGWQRICVNANVYRMVSYAGESSEGKDVHLVLLVNSKFCEGLVHPWSSSETLGQARNGHLQLPPDRMGRSPSDRGRLSFLLKWLLPLFASIHDRFRPGLGVSTQAEPIHSQRRLGISALPTAQRKK